MVIPTNGDLKRVTRSVERKTDWRMDRKTDRQASRSSHWTVPCYCFLHWLLRWLIDWLKCRKWLNKSINWLQTTHQVQGTHFSVSLPFQSFLYIIPPDIRTPSICNVISASYFYRSCDINQRMVINTSLSLYKKSIFLPSHRVFLVNFSVFTLFLSAFLRRRRWLQSLPFHCYQGPWNLVTCKLLCTTNNNKLTGGNINEYNVMMALPFIVRFNYSCSTFCSTFFFARHLKSWTTKLWKESWLKFLDMAE